MTVELIKLIDQLVHHLSREFFFHYKYLRSYSVIDKAESSRYSGYHRTFKCNFDDDVFTDLITGDLITL